jgi:hypothetical protein
MYCVCGLGVGGLVAGAFAGLRHKTFQGIVTNGMQGFVLATLLVCFYDNENKARKIAGRRFWN